ncbi:MAG TPA: DinB family protein [Acidimicrobiales bacterium]|nr:DinB family protein [Acidimicrobiales bacterium]
MRCDECGFDGEAMSNDDLVAACHGFARRYRAPLTRFLPNEDGPAVLRRRPAPEVWSALEYAAHTRDVLAFYRERVSRVLTEDRPTLHSVGFASREEEATSNDEDPAAVADGVTDEATQLATSLERLDAEQWQRVGLASDGSGAERTVRVLAERAVHDASHHLLDIGRSLRAARS